MANTHSATLSIRLKPEFKKRLLAEARQGGRQVASGHYVNHEDIKAWLLSWGTAGELPPPKCVCGRAHDDEALCLYGLPGLRWPAQKR